MMHSHVKTPRMQRVDTLDLKEKLTKALGHHASTYWQALRDFCNSRLSRPEFEEQASMLLKSEHSKSAFDAIHHATFPLDAAAHLLHQFEWMLTSSPFLPQQFTYTIPSY
jgi:inactivated superfamily I helicase